MIDTALFREGMRHLAASVNIITSIVEGERCGCTASAVCSLSDTPPSLIVCLNQSTQTAKAIADSKRFCVNLCSSRDIEISNAFATSKTLNKFDFGDWEESGFESPRLKSAVVAFDCSVGEIMESGTHFVIVGLIQNLVVSPDSESKALVYENGQYGSFIAAAK